MQDNLASIWEETLSRIEPLMPQSSFNTWLRGTRPLTLSNNVLYVRIANEFAKDWVDSRYREPMQQALQKWWGQDWQLEFILPGTPSLINLRQLHQSLMCPRPAILLPAYQPLKTKYCPASSIPGTPLIPLLWETATGLPTQLLGGSRGGQGPITPYLWREWDWENPFDAGNRPLCAGAEPRLQGCIRHF